MPGGGAKGPPNMDSTPLAKFKASVDGVSWDLALPNRADELLATLQELGYNQPFQYLAAYKTMLTAPVRDLQSVVAAEPGP